MKKPDPIVIALSDEQKRLLVEHLAAVGQMAKDGRPGMLFAQLDATHMVVGCVEHLDGKAIFKIVNGENWKGQTVADLEEKTWGNIG